MIIFYRNIISPKIYFKETFGSVKIKLNHFSFVSWVLIGVKNI